MRPTLSAAAAMADHASSASATGAPFQMARSSASVTAPGVRTRDWGLGAGDWLGIFPLQASVKDVQHSPDAVGRTQHRVNSFGGTQRETSREHEQSLGFGQRAPRDADEPGIVFPAGSSISLRDVGRN